MGEKSSWKKAVEKKQLNNFSDKMLFNKMLFLCCTQTINKCIKHKNVKKLHLDVIYVCVYVNVGIVCIDSWLKPTFHTNQYLIKSISNKLFVLTSKFGAMSASRLLLLRRGDHDSRLTEGGIEFFFFIKFFFFFYVIKFILN